MECVESSFLSMTTKFTGNSCITVQTAVAAFNRCDGVKTQWTKLFLDPSMAAVSPYFKRTMALGEVL